MPLGLFSRQPVLGACLLRGSLYGYLDTQLVAHSVRCHFQAPLMVSWMLLAHSSFSGLETACQVPRKVARPVTVGGFQQEEGMGGNTGQSACRGAVRLCAHPRLWLLQCPGTHSGLAYCLEW